MFRKSPSHMPRGLLLLCLGCVVLWIILSDSAILLIPPSRHALSIALDVLGDAVCLVLVALVLLLAHRYNQALRESEAKYRIVAENTYDWEFWADADRRFVYVSPSCARVTGHDAEEFLSNPELIMTIIHPEDRELYRQHVDEVGAKRALAEVGFRILRPDGAVRWIHHVCRPVFDKAGRFQGIRGSNRDVTDRRQAAEALRLSSQRTEDILSSITEMYLELDREWRVTDINPQLESFVGKTRAQLLGKVFWEEFPKSADSEFHEKYKEAVATQTPVHFETPSTVSPGTWFEVHAYPSERGVSVYLREITERKRSEQALRESEERYRTLIDLCPDAVLVHGPETIYYANAAAAEMLGASDAEDLVGRPILSIVHRDHHATSRQRMKEILGEDKKMYLRESHLVRLDGSDLTSEGTAMRVTYAGKPAVQSVLRDVTARKQTEVSLRESESRYRTLVELCPDAILVHCEGVIVYANSAAVRLFGASDAADLVGKTVLSLSHPASPESLLRKVRRAEEQGRPIERQEHTLLRMSGASMTVEVTGMEVPHHGRPAVLSVMRDVSERKHAEQERLALLAEVRQERDRLMTLIDSITDEVWFCEADGKVSLVNLAAAQGLGVEDRDSLLRFLPHLTAQIEAFNLDGSRRNARESHLLRSLKGEVIRDEDVLVRHVATGELRYRRASSAPLRDLNGRIVGAVQVVRDVTDRVRAQQERDKALAQAQEERDRLRTLIDAMTDEVWFCDADGKVSLVNAAVAEGLGVRDRDSLLRTIPHLTAKIEAFNPDGTRRTARESHLLRSLKGEVIRDDDVTVRHVETGELRYRRASSAPLRDPAGRIIGAVQVVRDVTDRRRAEDALKKK